MNIVVKADTKGSLQAVLAMLEFPMAEVLLMNPDRFASSKT